MRDGKAIIIVLDSVGAGAMPDASRWGDEGADTLGHTMQSNPGLRLPNLQKMGLGNALALLGPGPLPPADRPQASYGLMLEASPGKDTTTGHWELAGLVLPGEFRTFHRGFPPGIIDEFIKATGRGVIGNRAASGTAIIEELGPEQARTGDWIVYTSADSVFQLAAHEGVIPLDELYRGCEAARRILNPLKVGRVIARPFVGGPGAYRRTYNRRDYSLEPFGPTLLDALTAAGVPVTGVGKISDIFAGRGVASSIHTEGNADGICRTVECIGSLSGLIFVNLVDYDMLYGHRRNPEGYGAALEVFDRALPGITGAMHDGDLLIITADHGCDPTFARHTDHTREYVPLIAYSPGCAGRSLGIRGTFADAGATVAAFFGAGPLSSGGSFLDAVTGEGGPS
ncbi:MAG: phosphopentomutase [Myxococcota bacterium]|jgi:phosphopentomutase